jgi:hypothetical protein
LAAEHSATRNAQAAALALNLPRSVLDMSQLGRYGTKHGASTRIIGLLYAIVHPRDLPGPAGFPLLFQLE